jgi:hypothetical protein
MIVTIIVVLSGTGQYLFSAFLVQSFRLSNVSALQTFERFLFQLLAEAIHPGNAVSPLQCARGDVFDGYCIAGSTDAAAET